MSVQVHKNIVIILADQLCLAAYICAISHTRPPGPARLCRPAESLLHCRRSGLTLPPVRSEPGSHHGLYSSASPWLSVLHVEPDDP